MITYLLINAHIKFENEILSQVGLDSWDEIEDADYYISVNSKIALEKYDDICFFKSHRTFVFSFHKIPPNVLI